MVTAPHSWHPARFARFMIQNSSVFSVYSVVRIFACGWAALGISWFINLLCGIPSEHP